MAASSDKRSERAPEFFQRNERLRRERLREDARRPGGELLDEAMRLSAFAVSLSQAPRRERG